MNCPICGQPETHFNMSTGRREPVKHSLDVKAVICSRCMQRLLAMGPDELKAAYQKAMEVGEPDKARAIEGFIIDKETTGNGHGERNTPERIDGKRSVRAARYERKAAWRFTKKERAAFHKAIANG
jgi:hypothetical protein